MNGKTILVVALVFALTAVMAALASCRPDGDGKSANLQTDTGDAVLNPVETFSATDAPETFTVGGHTVTGPWGYGRESNANRGYPLLVSGFWGEGQGAYTARPNSYDKRFPAFTIDWQKDGEGDGEALAEWIDLAVASGFRIDRSRIYLTGFSRGGSGSFPLAKGMDKKGKHFAAIIRVAGQSQSDIGNGIASKTSVWYHIGLNDDDVRVNVARATLARYRTYSAYSAATERIETDDTCGVSRTTVTLTPPEAPAFRYSEYSGMGHESGPCYRDPELFVWLFGRVLR